MSSFLTLAVLPAFAAPVWAGEKVIYDSQAPVWVKPVDLASIPKTQDEVLLFDRQLRAQGGKISSYFDVAFQINNQAMLQRFGTLKLTWFPDKGDLAIYNLSIIRDGKPIDLVAQGVRFEVLRREANLEKRSLDGRLTATVAVPGLQVGDILRYGGMITNKDQALAGNFQTFDKMFAEPTKMAFARFILSWPEGRKVVWKSFGTKDHLKETSANGFHSIAVDMPLEKPEEIPSDAPARFRLIPHVQASSFASWKDVSALMAGHFATENAIEPGGPIDTQVRAIMAQSDDPLVRAAKATQLVQDEISYLLNGLNGGNYLPQSPGQTWKLRYGDCKAKTLLLLSMLRAMRIESEAALVRSKDADAIIAHVPSLLAFDHVIVKARIKGKTYWLDGTLSGTRLDTLDEVPPAGYALPLSEQGSDLIPIKQKWQEWNDNNIKVVYDYSAGLDMPALVDITMISKARMGARLRDSSAHKTPDEIRKLVSKQVKSRLGDYVLYDTSISYDKDTGTATLKASGLLGSEWEWERGKGSLGVGLESTGLKFKPDRARPKWREIPLARSGPLTNLRSATFILPGKAESYTIKGLAEVEEVVAGMKVSRKVSRDGNRLTFVDRAQLKPGEIAAADLRAQRAAAARLRSGDPVLQAPKTARRYWQQGPKANKRQAKRLLEAADKVIAEKPEDAWRYSTRAAVREYLFDNEGAIADYTKAIEIEPSVDLYLDRASLYRESGDYADAIADSNQAYELDPSSTNAVSLAQNMAADGKLEEALSLLDSIDPTGDDRVSVLGAKAQVLGEMGQKDDAWDILSELALDRPGDAEVLSAQCWFMASWTYKLEEGANICDEAVRRMDYSADSLDSRALLQFRRGDTGSAIGDLNAALARNPGFGPSLFLRGVIKRKLGEKDSGNDLEYAKRLNPDFPKFYERIGIKP